MNRDTLAICLTALAVVIMFSGCATKRYGRMAALVSKEADTLSCPDIDDEIMEAETFLADVYSAKFTGADVMGILGDFGIGNSMERDAALRSGKTRLESLYLLREARCGVEFPEDWMTRLKAEARVMAEEKKAERKRTAKYNNPRHRGDYIVTPDADKRENPWK